MDLIKLIDNAILEFIRANMSNRILDKIMIYITMLGNGGFIWIIAAIIFLMSKKYRKDGLLLACSLLLCVLIGNITLKPFVARMRPSDINMAIPLLIPRPTDFSFPSGHTMSSFAASTVIFHANNKMGVVAFVLAILIAFSRLYLYVHYPSDVVAAIIIGVLISVFTINFYKIKNK